MGFVLVVFFLVLIVVDIVEILVGGENGFVVFIGDLGYVVLLGDGGVFLLYFNNSVRFSL